MKPNNENNFLIEVTPEVASELRQLFMHADEEPYVLHFSPYWKPLTTPSKEKEVA